MKASANTAEMPEGAEISLQDRGSLPLIQYALVRGLKTLVGNASTNALPNRLFSAEALTQLVAFNTQWIRQGLC